MKYTEKELDKLIDHKIEDCNGLPNVCRMLGNEVGKARIKKRVKELIFEGGIHDIEAALAQIESQLYFEIE